MENTEKRTSARGIKREDGFCWIRDVIDNLPKDSVYRRVIRAGKGSYFTGYSDGYDAVPFLDHVRYAELADQLGDKLIIGKFVCMAPDVQIILGGNQNHPLTAVSQHPLWFLDMDGEWRNLKSRGDTVIEDEVWIGTGATIMPGVRIGQGARILPGAVVVKNVEPYSEVGGVSAKEVRKRFSDKQIDLLLNKIRWSEWPDAVISEHVKELLNPDPNFEKLVKVAEGLEQKGLLLPVSKPGEVLTLTAFMDRQNIL